MENTLIKHNRDKGEANLSRTAEYVTITRLKALETKSPEIYKTKYHASTGADFNKILTEFMQSNHPETYATDSIKISMRKQDNQLYLKLINNQYQDTNQLTAENWENQVYPLTLGK